MRDVVYREVKACKDVALTIMFRASSRSDVREGESDYLYATLELFIGWYSLVVYEDLCIEADNVNCVFYAANNSPFGRKLSNVFIAKDIMVFIGNNISVASDLHVFHTIRGGSATILKRLPPSPLPFPTETE